MIKSILNYFGYIKANEISQSEDLFDEKVAEKDVVVARINSVQKTTLISEDGKELNNEYPIGYICLEKPNGTRYYKYYGFTGNYNFSFDKEKTKIFVNYIAPWLNGAETIPEDYVITKDKKIYCLHCNEGFYVDSDELQLDYLNCKKCNKTNINKFKFTEGTIKEYELKIVGKYLCEIRDSYDQFIEKGILTKTDERTLRKLIGIIYSDDGKKI